MTRDIVDAVTSRAAINLTPGRQALAASQIAARFDDAERVVFGALAAEVEHEARRAVALGRSRVKPTGAYGDEAGDADIAVDATLAVFDSLLSGYERSHGPDTDAGSAARALRTRLLPRGLAAIAQAAYPDELAQIKSLLDADPDVTPYTVERFAEELAPYFEEHGAIRTDPVARGAKYIEIERDATLWRVKQTLLDPEAHAEWFLDFDVDIDKSREEGNPVLRLGYLGT